MTVPESFNPYQAPKVQDPDEVRLDEDSEFLISEREILCRETVELPKICIHTGQPADLQRHATFRSPQIPMTVVVVLIAVLASRFTGILELALLALTVPLGIGLIHRFTTWKVFPGMTTIGVTWYVNSDYARRCNRQKWIIRGIIFVVAFLGGFAFSAFPAAPASTTLARDAGLSAIVSALLFGGLSLTLRIERTLRYSGRRRSGPHKGLFSLTGHSRRFAETVERIIHGGF